MRWKVLDVQLAKLALARGGVKRLCHVELTCHQVKGPSVVWIGSHLTGQEVQLRWWPVNLRAEREII